MFRQCASPVAQVMIAFTIACKPYKNEYLQIVTYTTVVTYICKRHNVPQRQIDSKGKRETLHICSAALFAVVALSFNLVRRFPMQRFGTPEEIARAVLFLSTADSAYILGAEIAVDGGISQL